MIFFYKQTNSQEAFKHVELINGVANVIIEPNTEYTLALRSNTIYDDDNNRGKDDELWLSPEKKSMQDRDYIITSPEVPQQYGILWNKFPNRASYSAWGKMKNAIVENQLANKKIDYDMYTQIGVQDTGVEKYADVVIFPDGQLALIQSTNLQAMKWDITEGNVLLFGGQFDTTAVHKYSSGVLLHNGMILCIPFDIGRPAVLDLISLSQTEFTRNYNPRNPSSEPDPFPDDTMLGKYSDGVLLMDGRVLMIPFNSYLPNIIDPITQKPHTFGSSDIMSGKYKSGVLLDDGRVLMIPYNATQPAIIDPNNETIHKFGTVDNTFEKYSKGVLLIDGTVLAIPYNSSQFAIIDPFMETITKFGPIDTAINKYSSGLLTLDGRVVAIPYNSPQPAMIDTILQNITPFGKSESDQQKYCSGKLLPNGEILFIPYSAQWPIFYKNSNADYGVLPDMETFLSGYVNK